MYRILTWRAPISEPHGLPIWAPFLKRDEAADVAARVTEALDLLRTHSPQRFGRVRRSIRGFMVFGKSDEYASYHRATRICELNEKFLATPEATVTAIATVLVHEATHGWLFDLGIPYDEPKRHRVELICFKAELLTAQRLPDSESELVRCRNAMSMTPEYFSDASRLERNVGRLRELGCPEWIIRTAVWARRRRAA
jgi:hypothetical protein